MGWKKGKPFSEEHKERISQSVNAYFGRTVPECRVRAEKAYELYQAGKTLRGVGDEIGLTGQAVLNLLRKFEYPTRTRGEAWALTMQKHPDIGKRGAKARKDRVDRKLKMTKKEVCALYKKVKIIEVVSEQSGVGVGVVRRILRECGVSIIPLKGRRVPDKTRAKISAAKMGKKRPPMTQEWKDKIAAKARERWADPAQHKKFVKALRKGKEAKASALSASKTSDA